MQKTLKEWRAVRGMSQHSLSAESGVQQATISNLENGITLNVKPETIRRLIRALGIPFEDLDLEQIHIIQPKDGTNGSVALPEGFPEQLEAARQAAGLTLEKVAERLGLSDKTVKHVVSGKTRRVKPDTLKAMQGFVAEYTEGESCDMGKPSQSELTLSQLSRMESQATGLSTDKKAQTKEAPTYEEPTIKINIIMTGKPTQLGELVAKLGQPPRGVTYELH